MSTDSSADTTLLSRDHGAEFRRFTDPDDDRVARITFEEAEVAPTDTLRVEYTDMKAARLFYGLWVETGGFSFEPDDRGDLIPLSVALAGKAPIATYLAISEQKEGHDSQLRQHVADRMNIGSSAVGNYWNRIRWKNDRLLR